MFDLYNSKVQVFNCMYVVMWTLKRQIVIATGTVYSGSCIQMHVMHNHIKFLKAKKGYHIILDKHKNRTLAANTGDFFF